MSKLKLKMFKLTIVAKIIKNLSVHKIIIIIHDGKPYSSNYYCNIFSYKFCKSDNWIKPVVIHEFSTEYNIKAI